MFTDTDNFSVVYYGRDEIKPERYNFYPFYEEYKPDKIYGEEIFEANFDPFLGKRLYKYGLFQSDKKSIVFAKEQTKFDADYKDLQKYCTCRNCEAYKTPWLKHLFSGMFLQNVVFGGGCRCCSGCLWTFSHHSYEMLMIARKMRAAEIAKQNFKKN